MTRRLLVTLATAAAVATFSSAAALADPPQDVCIGIENDENNICIVDENGLGGIELPPLTEVTRMIKVGGGL